MVDRIVIWLESIHRFFEVKSHSLRTIFLLLIIHASLLAYLGYVQSPTLNEPGHLAAGLAIWKFGDLDIYCVNPPLVRTVAALPVALAGYNQDWSKLRSHGSDRPEFPLGEAFVTANGERSFALFMIARWICIPFACLGAVICYAWGSMLYGRPAGLLACAIWCFEPNILAHAALITPDAHATALGLASSFMFWRWLKETTWAHALLSGLVLGLASLAKMTFLIYYGVWPLIWLAYRWPDGCCGRRRWSCDGVQLMVCMLVALCVLNSGYGFHGTFRPLNAFRFVSAPFQSATAPPVNDSLLDHDRGQRSSSIARRGEGVPTSDAWLGMLRLPLPKSYIYGLDRQQQDFDDDLVSSYLRGTWRDKGWWYYYAYAFAIKVPTGLLCMVTYVAICGVLGSRAPRKLRSAEECTNKHGRRDTIALLAPAAAIFTIVSLEDGFNEHFRYVLPALPFLFIWAAQLARSPIQMSNRARGVARDLGLSVSRNLDIAVSIVLLTWIASSSVWHYPHELSYFNELIGGSANGPRHLLGSNVDWGQDLRFLKWWMDDQGVFADDVPCHLAYVGLYEPAAVGIQHMLPISPATKRLGLGQVANSTRPKSIILSSGWYFVSVNFLYGSGRTARDGSNGLGTPDPVSMACLRKIRPLQRIGESIYVYYLSQDMTAN